MEQSHSRDIGYHARTEEGADGCVGSRPGKMLWKMRLKITNLMKCDLFDSLKDRKGTNLVFILEQ